MKLLGYWITDKLLLLCISYHRYATICSATLQCQPRHAPLITHSDLWVHHQFSGLTDVERGEQIKIRFAKITDDFE